MVYVLRTVFKTNNQHNKHIQEPCQADMASIHNPQEKAIVDSLLAQAAETEDRGGVWIGGQQRGSTQNNNGPETEQDWYWVDGSPWYDNNGAYWAPGQPDNAIGIIWNGSRG